MSCDDLEMVVNYRLANQHQSGQNRGMRGTANYGLLIAVIGGIGFVIGTLCCMIAMTTGRTAPFWQMWWRGSLQRSADYTPEGWRLWCRGAILQAVGFAAAVAGMLMNSPLWQ